MKASLLLALTFMTANAWAEASMSGTSTTTTTSGATTSIPQAGTSAGSPQTAGPLNSPPNGAGGTYGYPNSAVDPNTANPGLPQQPDFGGPYYNYGGGTTSGTTTTPNAAGAPFVVPPATATPSALVPAVPGGTTTR